MTKLLPIIILTILLASCGGSDSSESKLAVPDPRIGEVKDDLNAAKQVWKNQDLIDYTFDFSPIIDRACLPDGVTPDPVPPKTVTVEDNEVTFVMNTSTGETVPIPTEKYFGTIDEIFEYLEQQLAEKPQVIALSFNKQNALPKFDDSLGYPRHFYLEFDNSRECSSTEIILSNFR